MPIDLPQPIADYFTADAEDRGSVDQCFTEAATVTDEANTYVGRTEIRRWKAEVSSKFSYVSEPFALEHDGDRFIVTSRVSGTFRGSPIDLRYGFVLDGDKIARLEIVP